jgi:hypothetical protein
MRSKIIFGLSLLFVACTSQISSDNKIKSSSASTWTQNEFVLGTFVNPKLSNYTDTPPTLSQNPDPLSPLRDQVRFRQVSEAYFNLMVRPFYTFLPKSQVIQELSWASQFSLKYLVADNRIGNRLQICDWTNPCPLYYDSQIASNVNNDYKSNSSVSGYYLHDEPAPSTSLNNFQQLSVIRQWIDYINTNGSGKMAYINLLPTYAFSNVTSYSSYLSEYLDNPNTSPSVISFDHYPLLESSPRTDYFTNLRLISQKSKNLGKPFWAHPVTARFQVGSTYAKEPDKNYLRFTSFSPIAYGAKGLIYYTYGTYPNYSPGLVTYNPNLSTSNTFTTATDERTNKYYWAQEINGYIKNVIGPAVMSSNHLGIFHNSNYRYEGYSPSSPIETIPIEERVSTSSPVIASFTDKLNNSMIGLFKSNTSVNTYYLFIVNRGYQGESLDVTVNLKGNFSGSVQASSVMSHAFVNVSTKTFANKTRFTISGLQPGEGRLVKAIQNSTSLPLQKADLSIKSDSGFWKIDYAGDGFGAFNAILNGYSSNAAHPVPADYDGDGKADLSAKTDDGRWLIDYAAINGFGGWDWQSQTSPGIFVYGNASAHPVPADYDGDGKADLSVKTDDGRWLIDYANNTFGSWDWQSQISPGVFVYGDVSAHPVPADYDGDGKADLSVKRDDGYWFIDYAIDGFGGWNSPITGYSSYENALSLPIPADYDGDGKSDFAIKTDTGYWKIDYANDGFGGFNAIFSGYSSNTAFPVPADYDGDGKADLSVKTSNGNWFIDYANDGFGTWNNPVAGYSGYEGILSIPVPADYGN